MLLMRASLAKWTFDESRNFRSRDALFFLLVYVKLAERIFIRCWSAADINYIMNVINCVVLVKRGRVPFEGPAEDDLWATERTANAQRNGLSTSSVFPSVEQEYWRVFQLKPPRTVHLPEFIWCSPSAEYWSTPASNNRRHFMSNWKKPHHR